MFYVADRFFFRSAIAGFDIVFCDIAFRISEFHLRPRLIRTAEHACANSRRCTRSLYIFAIAAGGVVQRFLLDRKVGGDENFKQKSLV